jgi:hypothetical protein
VFFVNLAMRMGRNGYIQEKISLGVGQRLDLGYKERGES